MVRRSMRNLLVIAIAVGVVVAATAEAAAAKGAQVVTITGPGLAQPLRLDNLHDQPGVPGPNDVGNATGALMFASGEPNAAFTERRPAGPLGPRYRVTFRVMTGPDELKSLRQDVYPFARAGFVVYTPPGQRVFDRKAQSGWYVATKRSPYDGMDSDAATEMLVAVGVPARARV